MGGLLCVRSTSTDGSKSEGSEHEYVNGDEAKPSVKHEGLGITAPFATCDGGFDNPMLLDVEDEYVEVAPEVKPETPKKTIKIAEPAVSSSSEDEDEEEDDEDDEEGGEEEYLNPHVKFVLKDEEVLDRAEDEECKLTRKDTPHHLKGKKIINTDEDRDRLQEILMNIEKRKSDECDDLMKDADLTAAKCAVSFQNGMAVKSGGSEDEDDDEDDDDDESGTDDEEEDSAGIPFRYKKTTFEQVTEHHHEIAKEVVAEEKRENGDCKHVMLGDGEIVQEETIMKLYEELTAVIHRDGPSLGINIAGGLGTTSFQDDEQGVFITKISEDSPAGKLSVLNVGDKIIKVNGTDISHYSHDDAVNELRNAGDVVTLVALREVTNEEEINMSLNREEKNVRFAAEPEVEDIEIEALTIPVMLKRDAKGLGFSIAGGKGSNPYKGSSEGIYISKISDDGPAALDSRLQLGDKLLSVNGTNVQTSSHEEVVKILTEASDKVTLVAYREKVINKKMKPMSQINGVDTTKTAAERTKDEATSTPPCNEEEAKLLVEEIVLRKSEGPLGISIVGGCDRASHPFGVNDPGVFVSKVNPTGEAAKTNICVGDRILKVNERDMRTAMHHDAVNALITNEEELKLTVRHDPPPPGIKEISINKKLGEKLGISIKGGAKGHPGNPIDKNDEGIFVSKVNTSGAVARLGEVQVGMRILEVNNVSLLGASHVDAVRALRTAGDNLTMVIADGYDASLIDDGNQDGVLYNPALCEPARFSPDSASSATSGDSFPDETMMYRPEEVLNTTQTSASPVDTPDTERKSNSIRRTPSEQRQMDAEKRNKRRQDAMAALVSDSQKAQAVIQQSKTYSSTSLGDGNLTPTTTGTDEERTST